MLDMSKKEAKSRHSLENYPSKGLYENDANFQIGALKNMKNLMLLQLNYITFSGKYSKFPRMLRLLRWHGFSLEAIPADISLDKLVILDMSYSRLTRVWDDMKVCLLPSPNKFRTIGYKACFVTK